MNLPAIAHRPVTCAIVLALAFTVACSSGGGSDDAAARSSGQPSASGSGPSTSSTGATPTSATPSSTIGYLGCSNTRAVVAAYHKLGGTRFWPDIEDYGGGIVIGWSRFDNDNNVYWTAFKKELAIAPATLFWFQLCAYPDATDDQNYEAAVAAINGLRTLVPGAVVYISPVNGFVAPHLCRLLGIDGPSRLKAVADRVAASGIALRGPDVGDLLSTAAINSVGANSSNTQTDEDGCHPNDDGAAFLARNLMAFPAFSG